MGDMIPISHFSARTRSAFIVLGLAAALSAACLTNLRRAKLDYTAGQEHAAAMHTEQAVASWKRAADVAGRASLRRPSAQSYTVKGLAEANLGRWREAEASFLKAFGLGFAKGESWAADAALAGLAISFAEFGLEATALRMYAQILDRSDFRPALMFAAEKRTDMILAGTVGFETRERDRALSGLNKALDRLIDRDFACGFYHYLHAQVDGHLGDLRRSYEEAVMARELGLPTEKILRDNDNQLVYCYLRLSGSLPAAEAEAFAAAHARWAGRWGWRDARTPAWKKE
jgi:tetratricopeptide (TPR) repeat protein